MKKVRIYELSRKLGVSNKELMNTLSKKFNIEVKSHSSSVEDDVAEKVATYYKNSSSKQESKTESRPTVMNKNKAAGIKGKGEFKKPEAKKNSQKTIEPRKGQPQRQENFNKKRKRGQNGPRRFSDGSSSTIAERMKTATSSTSKSPITSKTSKTSSNNNYKTSKKSTTMTKSFPRVQGNRRSRSKRDRTPRIPQCTKKESVQKWLEIPNNVTVSELAGLICTSPNEIIKNFMKQGMMVTINQSLSFDDAAKVAKGYGFKIEKKKVEEVNHREKEDDESQLSLRPPVVAVLGHVDHGKTSLLDAIRDTNVTASESGGITQSIGASTVKIDDRSIVFVDTPGHEAFTAMRARGAQVTDIAILVVAADDGVMPQTVEAINHAKAADVPIIVAINKIDKNDANPDRVKQQLADFNLIAEDWGGDTVMVPVSARSRQGIDELLEMVILVADMHEFKANPNRDATGIVIESNLDKGFGPVATVIVKNGTLKVGDSVIVGNEYGKIRFMISDKGKRIKKVRPSLPAEIIGLSGIPSAGDHLKVVEDEKTAKNISDELKLKVRTDRLQTNTRVSLDDLFRQMQEGETKDLNIIIKADSNGSLEALKHSLERLSNPDVRISVIHGGVGAISESDVVLAAASNAIIIGFNVRPDPLTKRLAEQEKIDVRMYRVIYHIIEDIKSAMVGLLEPEYEEMFLGRAEVRNIFKISRIGVIAGCYVLEGKMTRNSSIRVLRDNVVMYEGKLDSLRRFKDDVSEVQGGFECGIFLEKFPYFQQGDIIESYTMKEIKREIAIPDEKKSVYEAKSRG